MHIEQVSYKGFSNAVRVTNGIIELITPLDFGMRILHLGFIGDQNEFFNIDPLVIPKDPANTWELYGGHRLWVAPEKPGLTDLPDNTPIRFEQHGDVIRFIQPADGVSRLEKEIDVRMLPDAASIEVTHRIRNHGVWDVQFALWALSVMRAGGTGIIPLPPRGTHPEQLLATSSLALWAYSDLSDPRFQFGRRYIYLHQDAKAVAPQKLGACVPDAWAAYVNDGHVFVKQFAYTAVSSQPLPDLNCNVEMFTNANMLELETLSRMLTLRPGAQAEHKERWTLARNVPAVTNDEEVDQVVLPLLSR
ncbi:MAG: hypothetical protein U0670_22560 [Anaerolineae bacterium]